MKRFHLITGVLIILYVLFCASGCSFKQADYAFEYHPFEKEEKFFKLLQEQSVFEIEDDQIMRIVNNRYMIYDDVEEAPISFGLISLIKGKVHLKRLNGEDVFSFKALDNDVFIFSASEKTMRLTPDYTETFYQPQNIFEAVRWGTLEDVKRLVLNGHSIERVDALGSYPLMEAVYYGNFPIVEYLVLSGVDVIAENYAGLTALHYALKAHNVKIVKLLLEHGDKELLRPCENFLSVMQQDDFELIKVMVDAGFNASCQQSHLLFWMLSHPRFSESQQLEYLNYFLKKDIKTDIFSPQGDTPLMRVAGLGKDKLLTRLIEYGVDLFVEDKQGRTALDYDSIHIDQKNPKIEQILKTAGLNVGLRAKADAKYDAAMDLFEKGDALEAYWQLVKLSDQYKNKNYYLGRIKVAQSLKKPTLAILKDLVWLNERFNNDSSANYYKNLIEIYKKMELLVPDDARKDANGDFKKDTLYDVVENIDRLYDRLLRYSFTTTILYQKYENLKKLNNHSGIIRGDLSNGNNSRFIGEIFHGKPFGKGALKYKDGSSYYGIVIHYKRHGKGKMIYKDGTIYDGMWDNDKRHGKGFFTNTENALYLGTYSHDKLIGEAKMVRPGRR